LVCPSEGLMYSSKEYTHTHTLHAVVIVDGEPWSIAGGTSGIYSLVRLSLPSPRIRDRFFS
jgi:hypothetical protein